jgi:hypothetical protein
MNGSLTKSAASSGTTDTYTFDVRNRMISFSNGSASATYIYDDSGDRVSETTAGTTTLWLTNTNNPTGFDQPMEQKSSMTATPTYTYIIGANVLGQVNSGGTAVWYLDDSHDSVRETTNSSAAVTSALDYNAFGVLTSGTPIAGDMIEYAGDGEIDPVSGIDFDGARPRDIADDEFLVRDWGDDGSTSDPITENPYIYGDGDPAKFDDPTGHFGVPYGWLSNGNGSANIGQSISEYNSSLLDIEAVTETGASNSIQNLVIDLSLEGLEAFWGAPDSDYLTGKGQGGPDITQQLQGLAIFFQTSKVVPPCPSTFVDWDFTALSEWGKWQNMYTAPGVVQGPDGLPVATVTVQGLVYPAAEVNYFLWGLWLRASGSSLAWGVERVKLHRDVWGQDINGDIVGSGVPGRVAWTEAGYYDNFSLAQSTAILGCERGASCAIPLGFQVNDTFFGQVLPDGTVQAGTETM